MASYYSNRMHGRRMSNGEKYHRDSMTCAHAKFALGTLLRVTNMKNGKSVVVRVTDRCARHARRIIDLSMAAAKQLGLVTAGVGTVLVERFHRKNEIPYRGICPGAEVWSLLFLSAAWSFFVFQVFLGICFFMCFRSVHKKKSSMLSHAELPLKLFTLCR